MSATMPPPIPVRQGDIPPELDRWNWGAFLLNWIWGIGNGTYIALLCFVPFGIVVMPFVLGFKGSAWAWRNGRWESVERFKRAQRRWAICGAITWLVLGCLIAALLGGIFYVLKTSDAYTSSVERVTTSRQAIDALGEPITTGWPLGSISIEGETGTATLTYAVSGPKEKGQAAVEARKRNGVWTIQSLVITIDGQNRQIDLSREIRAALPMGRS